MHELSIARSILDQVETLAVLQPGERYAVVRLRVGEVSGVEPGALRFGLQVLATDRGWSDMDFQIERMAVRRRCCACSFDFALDILERETRCPRCDERRTTLVGGDELEIASVDVESVDGEAAP